MLDALLGAATDVHVAVSPKPDAGTAGVDGADDLRLWSATDTELIELVRAADRLAARVAGLRARAVAECAARDLPARTSATGGTAWLAGVLTARPARAKAMWRTARQLEQSAPATSAALSAGLIDEDTAAVIACAVAALPDDLPSELPAAGEQFLLQQSATLNAASLTHLGTRLLDVVAPEVAEARLGQALAREDANAGRVWLSASDDRHGMVSLRGRFDVESWAHIATALDPLAAPQPPNAADASPLPDRGDGSRLAGVTPLDPVAESVRDTRPYGQRMAEALVELARRMLDAGELPATSTVKPHVVITVDAEALTRQVGVGVLDTGETLSTAAVRRLACDAQISTVMLDAHSHPLDLGRSQRLFTGPLRRALILRDRGCAFPGCPRPPSWCQGHHIRHWVDGGSTSLDNGVLLCGKHHRTVHAGDWTVHLGQDKRPWFTPPPWLDPDHQPRLNTTHLRL